MIWADIFIEGKWEPLFFVSFKRLILLIWRFRLILVSFWNLFSYSRKCMLAKMQISLKDNLFYVPFTLCLYDISTFPLIGRFHALLIFLWQLFSLLFEDCIEFPNFYQFFCAALNVLILVFAEHTFFKVRITVL